MGPFRAPEQFNFSQPNLWPEWKQRFQRFRCASKLDKDDEAVQVSALIYTMGNDAERILTSFGLDARQRQEYDTVLEKFDEYFVPKRNIIHERARFHARNQKPDESIEEYVRDLYELAAKADVRDKDEAIRDRLVLGILDRDLSERLQLKADLTLQDAILQARQYEQVKAQLSDQRRTNVDAVQFKKSASGGVHSQCKGATGSSRGFSGRRRRGRAEKSDFASSAVNVSSCTRCGRRHASTCVCPAQGRKCNKCSRLGHFATVCRTKLVQALEEKQVKEHFVGTLCSDSREPPWTTVLQFGGCDVKFKIDTGADVSVISSTQYKKLSPCPKLLKTNVVLKSVGGVLKCDGQFITTTRIHDQLHVLKVFVVQAITENLLSREAASRLGLVKRIEAVNALFGKLDKTPVQCPPVKIILKENIEPYSVYAARRIPIPLLDKVKEELKRMQETGIIEEITEPTDWCSPIVPVMKKSGSIRICVDYKKLNTAVKRERYTLPTLEDILHKLSGSAVYSKLDATSGFYQIPLDPDSAKLTTFIAPCGRYFFKRLPFGISSAPEIFQRTMETILKDVPNIICYFDDILVYSENEQAHEKHLERVMKTLASANLKLNYEKCELRKHEIEFLGHRISKNGISPDPGKVEAIIAMPDPTNVPELRRMLGMCNFLGRYLPSLSTVLQPLTQLLGKDREWSWGSMQVKAMADVKKLLTSAPTLAFYDPAKLTIVSSDASSYGIGGVLLQQHPEGLKAVAYCSRTLTASECRYAQIEKETLAAVWACEKFSRYLIGLDNVRLETDHKPIVPLINNRDLQDTPIRCQRMLMRLMRFSITAEYVPGKKLVIADALSRNPQLTTAESEVIKLSEDLEAYLSSVDISWSCAASDKRLKEIAEETRKDRLIQEAIRYTNEGWPKYITDVEDNLRDYYAVRMELSVHNGLLTRGTRIVVPAPLHDDILKRIHEGHLGITKCRDRAKAAVWWPGINGRIKRIVEECRHCQEKKPTQSKEPLIPTELPQRVFQKCAADLLEFKGQSYLVLVDYYSRFIDLAHIPNPNPAEVIKLLKSMFARQGIPEILVTDNGRQFTSREFQEFAVKWGFQHVTTSPHYPQGNGEAERAVQIAKKILQQDEPELALLIYRDTTISATGYSPAELACGRKLRTTLPTLPENLESKTFDKTAVTASDAKAKQSYKNCFDKRHGARPLNELLPGDTVLQKLDGEKHWRSPAVILQQCAPRSYIVQTPRGRFRHNRRHLRRSRNFEPEQSSSKPSPVQNDFSLYTSQVPVTGEPETALHVSDPIQCPESTSSKGLIKPKKYDWKDSNLALFGSELERNIKKASASTEEAWKGAGRKPGLQIWRIVKFKVTSWPKEEYGKFYSGDSYIVMNTYKEPGGEELQHDIHFWIGRESTQDEYGTAAYKTVELDTYLNDVPIQHREVQGFESDLFRSYFKTITIMSGGAESGFRHVKPEEYKPRLLHFCGTRKNIEVKEVPLCKSRLKSDDVFILDLGNTLYQWNGTGSNKDERFKAMQYVQALDSERSGRPRTEVLEESSTEPSHEFYKALTNEDDDDDDSAFVAKDKETELYRLSDASGQMTFRKEKRGSVDKNDLDTKDVFIIDTKKSCYVWIGRGTSEGEKKNAMQYAHCYLQKTDHPLVPVSCYAEGREPHVFFQAIAVC